MPNTFDLDSWVIGYELGFAGNPMPTLSIKQPVAYLYNGVQLPAPPDGDEDLCPCACIYKSYVVGSVRYCFARSSEPFKWNPDGGILSIYSPYSSWLEDDEWPQGTQFEGWWDQVCQVVWTNVNILQEDGTLHLEASDPIPVYE